MTRYLWIALFILLCFCGQKEEKAAIETDKIATHEVAKQILTEDELNRFIKAFPVYKAETARKNIEWKGFDPKGDILSEIGAYIKANKDFAEIDAKMTGAGMPLKDFWPALVKTTMVFSAVMLDSAMGEAQKEIEKSKKELAAMEAKLKDPKISAAEKSMIKMALDASKALINGLNTMTAIYDSIPSANKVVVKKHFDELKTIFETK